MSAKVKRSHEAVFLTYGCLIRSRRTKVNREHRRKQERALRIRNKQRRKEKEIIQNLFDNSKQCFLAVIKQMM